MKSLAVATGLFLSALIGAAEDVIRLQSPPERVSLLELYTSEGCSSCPPAEAWFSKLKENPGLWKHFVPVAFHVDYWDHLGWRDRFATKEFTARQRRYSAAWNSDTIYTPGFVLQGKESRPREVPTASKAAAGILTIRLDEQRGLAISYAPIVQGKSWEAHVARLGFDLDSAIKAGENSGRTLRHDFTVITLQAVQFNDPKDEIRLALPPRTAGEKAIAVWVTEKNKLDPVQAVGGWLK